MADLTATVTQPGSAQGIGPGAGQGLGGAAIQMALGLLLILFVIMMAYWLLRRFGPRMGIGPAAKPHGLRVEGHLTLGPRKNIMVVRFLNKLLVLGVTDQSINLLTEVDDSDDTKDFKTALEEAAGRADGAGKPGDSGASGSGPGG